MGCAAATARRRRKQAVNGYKHMAPMRRPHYKVRSKDTASRREAFMRERRLMMEARKGQRKK